MLTRINRLATATFGLCLLCWWPAGISAAEGPFMATGFKVGEVTAQTAIVWTRLTRHAQRNPADGPEVELEYATRANDKNRRKRIITGIVYPPGKDAGDLRDAAPGSAGEVRVRYRPGTESQWLDTGWQPVDPESDFTRQFTLESLQPGTRYQAVVEARRAGDEQVTATLDGTFKTAPAPDEAAPVVFTVTTGQAYPDRDGPEGFKLYDAMRKLDPSFFVHTGDIVYYDRLAKNAALARYHWQRTYSLRTNVDFHRHVSSYFIKDDHDVFMNDCWPSMQTQYMFQLTFEQGLKIFREQVPMGERTYRTRRWGKDLQVWMVEGRDFRSPNSMPDGPDKTIWGAAQKEWFRRTVAASDATFRILFSPTPIVGPDRTNKHDNLSNSNFQYEGNDIRKFIASQQNMVVVCGDRHWQYISVDPKTGVREYSCGPASDRHAGGWRKDDFRPEIHRYLNVHGGFLAGFVDRHAGRPALTFRYYDTDGKLLKQDVLSAK